jgi:hypothetical protein
MQERRDPKDIDVVTFVTRPDDEAALLATFGPRPDLLDGTNVQSVFHVDHYLFPLYYEPEVIIENTRYWYGLFSHRRDPDRTWKGMLRVELGAKVDDDRAFQVLRSKP